jgi:hypothetical protein
MNNYVTRSLTQVGKGESFGWSTLQLSNIIIIVFLLPNVTSVVQPLDQRIITPFKVWYKKRFSELILSQFYSFTTQHDLKKIMQNVR